MGYRFSVANPDIQLFDMSTNKAWEVNIKITIKNNISSR